MHYDDLYQQDMVDEFDRLRRTSESRIPDSVRLRERATASTNKQTEGKPEGARYCFLTYIQEVTREFDPNTFSELQKFADLLEQDLTYHSLRNMYFHIEAAACGDVSRLWDEVIGVRYQAIKSGKYKPDSYKEIIDITLLQDAMARHFIKFLMADKVDHESGYSHLAHIVANILICIAQLGERDK